MKTINLADVSPKRRYTADPKYPMRSNWVIDSLIELIENGETFTDDTLCVVDSKHDCVVSRFKEGFTKELLNIEFEQADNPIYINYFYTQETIFRWNNTYYYLTY
jgi:hypothetical protein